MRRGRVNLHLLAQIQQLFGLEGYTGDTTPGQRKGNQAIDEERELGQHNRIVDDEDLEGEDADDIDNDQIDGIVAFVTSLSS